ncbi:hypothetical protein [Lysobacter gummosus]
MTPCARYARDRFHAWPDTCDAHCADGAKTHARTVTRFIRGRENL